MEKFNELLEAIAHNQEYTYKDNHMIVCAKPGDNSYSVEIRYVDSEIDKLRNNFIKWSKSIDGDIWTEACENIEKLKTLSDCFNSDDIESVRSAIYTFKTAYNNSILSKIKNLREEISNLKSKLVSLQ